MCGVKLDKATCTKMDLQIKYEEMNIMLKTDSRFNFVIPYNLSECLLLLSGQRWCSFRTTVCTYTDVHSSQEHIMTPGSVCVFKNQLSGFLRCFRRLYSHTKARYSTCYWQQVPKPKCITHSPALNTLPLITSVAWFSFYPLRRTVIILNCVLCY